MTRTGTITEPETEEAVTHLEKRVDEFFHRYEAGRTNREALANFALAKIAIEYATRRRSDRRIRQDIEEANKHLDTAFSLLDTMPPLCSVMGLHLTQREVEQLDLILDAADVEMADRNDLAPGFGAAVCALQKRISAVAGDGEVDDPTPAEIAAAQDLCLRALSREELLEGAGYRCQARHGLIKLDSPQETRIVREADGAWVSAWISVSYPPEDVT